MDHILPKSVGGRAVPENLRAAHRHCNKIRGTGAFDSAGIKFDPIDVLGPKDMMKRAWAA